MLAQVGFTKGSLITPVSREEPGFYPHSPATTIPPLVLSRITSGSKRSRTVSWTLTIYLPQLLMSKSQMISLQSKPQVSHPRLLIRGEDCSPTSFYMEVTGASPLDCLPSQASRTSQVTTSHTPSLQAWESRHSKESVFPAPTPPPTNSLRTSSAAGTAASVLSHLHNT